MERLNFEFLFKLRRSGMENVIDFCVKSGLIAESYVCPKCGKNMKLGARADRTDKFVWFCRQRSPACHTLKRSIRAGSWFAKSHLTIPDILLLTNFFLRESLQKHIMGEMRMAADTVCEWRALFREICMEACLQMNQPIGGRDKSVVIEVTKFDKRKGHRIQGDKGEWVFGGMEVGTNHSFFKLSMKKDRDSLLNVVKNYVLPGTTVYSDWWKTMGCLEDEEFKTLATNNSLNLVRTDDSGKKKKSLQSPSSDLFDPALGEYLWRRCHAETDDLMRAFLDAAKAVFPPMSCDPPLPTTNDDGPGDEIIEEVPTKSAPLKRKIEKEVKIEKEESPLRRRRTSKHPPWMVDYITSFQSKNDDAHEE